MKRTCALKGLLSGVTLAAVLMVSSGCEGLRWGRQTAPTPAPPPTEVSDQQSDTLAEAQAALDRGEYDEAMRMFRSVLAENPTITTAYVGIGDIYMHEEDYERAEPVYARAARLEPRNFDAQYGHGRALQMLNRFVDAVRAYHRALTIQPDHPKANLNLATTYLQMDNPSSALIFAEKAVEVAPDNGAARVNLGAVYEQLGRNAEAIEHYLIALELIDDNAPLMLNLINVLGKEQRYREAVNTGLTLVRVEPSANAYERLGWGYFRLNEFDNSINAYRAAVELDDRHWPSWSGIGVNALNAWLLSDRQDSASFTEARNAFRRSLQINSNQPRLVTLMSNYGL